MAKPTKKEAKPTKKAGGIDEVKAALESRGVPFNSDTTEEQLRALLAESEPKGDEADDEKPEDETDEDAPKTFDVSRVVTVRDTEKPLEGYAKVVCTAKVLKDNPALSDIGVQLNEVIQVPRDEAGSLAAAPRSAEEDLRGANAILRTERGYCIRVDGQVTNRGERVQAENQGVGTS
jgi:hypothetical protein